MDKEAVIADALTKRGFVIALVTSAAVLGAGFGLLPGLFGSGGDDPRPAQTTHADPLPEDETTDAIRDVETAETTRRAATTRLLPETTETATTPTTSTSTTSAITTGSDASSPTTDDEPDVSFTPTTSDESASAGAEMEVNVTIGTRQTIPVAVAG